ncbi:MAG: hypothetical protein WKF71_10010 [Pyrinomonadaceae bacterium]
MQGKKRRTKQRHPPETETDGAETTNALQFDYSHGRFFITNNRRKCFYSNYLERAKLSNYN